MSLDRAGAEALGWAFVAEQPEIGYVRAEKFLVNGDITNQSGVTVATVLSAIDAWEQYPVQAPNTRTNDLVEPVSVAEPVDADEVTA